LQQAIRGFAQNYNPKILYVLMNKRVSTRLLEQIDNEVINPAPGTMLDSGVVEIGGDKNFDIFMIANENPKTATALPVHYKIIHNTTVMSKREVEEFVYQMCYSYFGFGGPIKVPAASKYAEKLA